LQAQLRKSRINVSPPKGRSHAASKGIARAVDDLYRKTVEMEAALLKKDTSIETLEMLKTIAQQTDTLLNQSRMIKRAMAFETPERELQRTPLSFRAFDTDYLDFEIYDRNKHAARRMKTATHNNDHKNRGSSADTKKVLFEDTRGRSRERVLQDTGRAENDREDRESGSRRRARSADALTERKPWKVGLW
jgi:ribonuclease HI